MSKLRTAARLLRVTTLAVRLKEQRQFPLYVKSATAIIHKKQSAAFERSFTKAIVPLFKNQVKSILAKLRALPESAVSSAKSSELLQKIYNSEEWDAELVNRALPPIAVAMSESALATFNQFIQDVERRKSWGVKCGGPGSGVPGPCPTGIQRGTGTREDPIHCGENLKLAVKLLAEGHHIRLAQHEHVSTLVNKMHKTIQKAVKSGQVPPHFDLCKVSAPNSNLFCAEHKGYPRAKMPQMRGIPVPGSIAATLPVNKAGKVDVSAQFIKSLKNQGIKVKEKSIRASFLRASQAEIVGARVVELVKAAEAGTKDLRERPIFVSKDNYVLDGHHHWAAIVGLGAARGKDIKIPVYVVDVEIGESIDLANEFARSIGIAPKSGAAPAGKWYNGTGGNDDGIGREKQAGMGIDQATQGPEGKSGISDQGGLFGWDGSEFGRGGAVAGWDRQAEDELKTFCATGPGGGVDPTCSPGGGKPRQTETPEFKAWFGKSQIVNKDGSPKVMYHGTESKEDFTEFKPNSLGLIFTTEGANHASRWAGNWGNDQYGNKQRVYATYVKVENIYDGKNKDHIQAVLDYFTPEQHAASKAFWDDFWDKHPNGGVVDVHKVPPNLEGLKKGGWQSVEHPQILAAIRALGHDGILTGEVDRNGVLFRGVGVFSSTQMKSATGNSGAFDPNNPDITKAFCATGAGGGVDPTCSPGQSGKSGHRIKLDMVVQTSLGSETGFDFVSHEQIANSHIGKALGWKAETLEEQIGAMTGAVPGLKMSVVLNETGRSIEVQTEPGQLYEMQRTLYVNTKGTVTAHNDLFRIHKDKGSVPPGQGVKMFRDQVNALAEAGVSEIRTNAAGSKADGADWNGYYTWPLVGYDKALTTHDLKYVPDHPQYTGMDRISDVFSTREGAAWWKEHGQSLDDLVFDLSEGSYSRQRLEWYEADRAERGQPIPKAFDVKCGGPGSGVPGPCPEGRRESFAEWFKGSKLIDADGKPLVLYHGNKRGTFPQPDPHLGREPSNRGEWGIYLTPRQATAEAYGGSPRNVQAFHVAMKNPLFVENKSEVTRGLNLTKAHVDDLIRRGYDGIVSLRYNHPDEKLNPDPIWKASEIVAFNSDQLRSVGDEKVFDAKNCGESEHPGLFRFVQAELKTFCATGPGGGVDPSCGAGGKRKPQTETAEFKRWFGDSKVVDGDGKPLVVYHGTKAKDFTVFDTTNGFDLGTHFGNHEQSGTFVNAGYTNSVRVYPVYLKIERPLRMDDLGSWEPNTMIPAFRKLGVHVPDDWEQRQTAEWEKVQANRGDAREFRRWQKEQLRDMLEKSGYDGVQYLNKAEGYDYVAVMKERERVRTSFDDPTDASDEFYRQAGAKDSWMALRPTQIKSAVGNSGGFDSTDPDITKSHYGSGIKASTAMEWLDSLDDEDIDLEDVEYSTPYGNVSMGMATEYPEWMKKIITTRLQETFAEPYWADINRTTGGDIEGLLQRGLEEGWSIADMAREIEDRYGATDYPESRGRLIARTESGNALNGARSDTIDALIDDLGMRDKIRKVWLSVLGNTTRDDHAREDGVPADDDGYWMLGGERCRWPGDVKLSAKQRCNCMCSIVTQFGMNSDDAQGLIDEHRALQATATRQRKKSTGCGTGSGGFKPGNTCARGGGGSVEKYTSIKVAREWAIRNGAGVVITEPKPAAEAIADSLDSWAKDMIAQDRMTASDIPPKEQVVSNWMKVFRSRKESKNGKSAFKDLNPELHLEIQNALNQNHVNSKFQKFVTKNGKAPVIFRGEEKGRSPAAEYRAAIHVYDSPFWKGESESPLIPGEATAGGLGGYAAVIRHEYAHKLYGKLTREQQREWSQLVPESNEVAKGVTSYAAKNKEETFCEVFAIVTDPRYVSGVFPSFVDELHSKQQEWLL